MEFNSNSIYFICVESNEALWGWQIDKGHIIEACPGEVSGYSYWHHRIDDDKGLPSVYYMFGDRFGQDDNIKQLKYFRLMTDVEKLGYKYGI